MKGKLIGVGVGPGDPKLLTLKAVEVIQQADVIIVPKASREKESLAYTIAASHIPAEKKIVELIFPMISRKGTSLPLKGDVSPNDNDAILNQAWEQAANDIKKYLDKNRQVVFLTLGDPALYSTYGYIYKKVREAGYLVETIPGIPSFCAAAARLGVTLAEGEENLVIVPSLSENQDIDKILEMSDNAVFMKVSQYYPQLVAKLKEKGYLPSSVMISRCGHEDEEVVDKLEAKLEEKVDYMSIIIGKKGK